MSSEADSSTPVAAANTSTSPNVPLVVVKDNDNSEPFINWVEEATAIINDIRTHVAEIDISKKLPSSDSKIYLNIRTFEGAAYCVHVSNLGFRIVSELHDTIDEGKKEVKDDDEVFETPYALLDKISPRYVQSFGNQLCKQLLHLQQMRTEFNEEDEEGLEDEEEQDSGRKASV